MILCLFEYCLICLIPQCSIFGKKNSTKFKKYNAKLKNDTKLKKSNTKLKKNNTKLKKRKY